MPKMVFIDPKGIRLEVDAPIGLSVLEIAHKHGVDLEGACEGSLACSTCHVIIDPSWYEALKEPTEDEEDMLDLAFGLTKNVPPRVPDRDERGARRADGAAAGRHTQYDGSLSRNRRIAGTLCGTALFLVRSTNDRDSD